MGRSAGEGAIEVAMKTQGEIEAATCDGMAKFVQEYLGRGPSDIHTYLIGDMILICLEGVLTAAEQQLVKTQQQPGKGRDLLKQVRAQLIETGRPVLEAMIDKITGVEVVSMHHDISTTTGEEIVLFRLAARPAFRETRRKQ
jgi:uncharacterized protein YbcI